MVKELRSAYKAFADYRDGKHEDGSFSRGVYEEKFAQYLACEMTYLEKLGVDRHDDDKVRGVLSPLLCSSEVADTEARVVSETEDIAVSESPEVCAQVHAEASRDDDVETIESVADTEARVVSETEDVVVSESLEVCAQVHAEASNDEGVIDVVAAKNHRVSNAKKVFNVSITLSKVRSVLNLSVDSCGNIVKADVAAETANDEDVVETVEKVADAEAQVVPETDDVATKVRSTVSCPDVKSVAACVCMCILM